MPGGGAIAVSIHLGDHVRVVDLEGMQACELVAVDGAGAIDPAILGTRGNGDASGLKQILSGDSESARSVRRGLERRGIDLGASRAVTLFGGDSRPGESAEFIVSRDGLLIIAAPGGAMNVGAQDTATSIRLYIRRSRIRPANETLLPEPLADPFRTFASTGRRPKPMSFAPANISRSSTSPAANAPTFSALPRALSIRDWNIRSMSPRRAR